VILIYTTSDEFLHNDNNSKVKINLLSYLPPRFSVENVSGNGIRGIIYCYFLNIHCFNLYFYLNFRVYVWKRWL